MGRRSDIDWEKIQKLYLAGHMTLQEMSDECGVVISAITRKAKKNGWTRNLSVAIRESAKAKIAAIDVCALIEQSATESADKSAKTIKQAIDEASNIVAGVRLKHRDGLNDSRQYSSSLKSSLSSQLALGVSDANELLKLAQISKLISDVEIKIQEREDKIYNISDDDGASSDDETKEIIVQLVSANGDKG